MINLPADTSSPSTPFEPGTVWLVGAGPGDPGLLTLAARDALLRAEVIVYDALVSQAVLAMAAPTAALEFAGKRGGRPSHSQSDISQRLIDLARAGHRVVRLKGGDPFMFGRGGEEAAALAQAGVRFRILPGITAGLAGLAYAAIPATTRDTNQAIIFVTGHPAADGEDQVDWAGLAALDQPIVIYMGLGHLAQIAAKLLGGGRAPETPVALITHATLPEQRVVETTLADAAEAGRLAGVTSPLLIVVGRNVALRRDLLPYLISDAPRDQQE